MKPQSQPDVTDGIETPPAVRCGELVRRHATVVKDGYEVPPIGIPPNAVLEHCDLCGNEYGMAELTWSGTQMLCKKCASNDQAQAQPPTATPERK